MASKHENSKHENYLLTNHPSLASTLTRLHRRARRVSVPKAGEPQAVEQLMLIEPHESEGQCPKRPGRSRS